MHLPKWLISYPMIVALVLMAEVAALDLSGLRLTSSLALALGFFSSAGGRLLHRRLFARPGLRRRKV